jgi:ubiquinone/menaquinone biosynthesis C-methylase UbiE
MPKKIAFTKYQTRSPDYHWQQLSHNPFRFNAYVAARYQQILDNIPQVEGLKILDIGCGSGTLLYLIQQKNPDAQLTGIDLDQDSLAIARKKVKAKLIKTSATKLPFKAGSFDYVVSAEVIEHLDKPKKMLSEIKRVLQPLGTVLITTPVKHTPHPKDKLHVQEFTPKQLSKLLSQYFNHVVISFSHSQLLTSFYTLTLIRFNRLHLDIFRWLINLFVLIFRFNPFKLATSRPTQQLALVKP